MFTKETSSGGSLVQERSFTICVILRMLDSTSVSQFAHLQNDNIDLLACGRIK